MKAEPILRRTTYREVFRKLESAILSGDLVIDQPIPTEAALCELFQVKRSSVREGVRLLEQSGLVARNGSRRLVVCAPGKSQSSENIIRSITLNKVTLREIWQVQRELDSMAARLACDSISKSLLDQIGQNIYDIQNHRTDANRVVQLDMEFHNLIAEAADNRALTMARDPLGILLYASSDFVITGLEQSIERLIVAHTHIYDAIAANQPEQASSWMLRHLDDFKRGCLMAGARLDDSVADFVDQERLARIMAASA